MTQAIVEDFTLVVQKVLPLTYVFYARSVSVCRAGCVLSMQLALFDDVVAALAGVGDGLIVDMGLAAYSEKLIGVGVVQFGTV